MEENRERNKRDRELNKEKILVFLGSGPKGYTEIIEEVGLSGTAVNNILQNLTSERKVYKTFVDKQKEKTHTDIRGPTKEILPYKAQKTVYALTPEGYKSAQNIWWILHQILEYQSKQAEYVHSPSLKYGAFGLSHDEVRLAKDGELIDVLPTTSQIEDFIMVEVLRQIKSDKLKIMPSTGKVLLAFEVDFVKLSEELGRINAFIEAINSNNDVFIDSHFSSIPKENRMYIFDTLISKSLLFAEDKFKTNLSKYMNHFNKQLFIDTFGTIDFDFLNKFIREIKAGKDPIEDKRMRKKLLIRDSNYHVNLDIFAYIQAAKILKYSDKETHTKVSEYEQSKWAEYYERDSKLRKFIEDTRGE